MNRHLRLSNRFFLLGLGLLCLIVYTLILAAIAYIRGQVMNAWIFPIAVVMTGITQYFAARALFPDKPLKIFGQGLILILVIAAASIWTAGSIYDISFNGQWYHQETVRHLKTGWNPYLKYLDAPEIQVPPGEKMMNCSGPDLNSDTGLVSLPDPKYNIINHQPKGIEIAEAAIYSLTGRIETGKAINLFACLASFCLCLSWLYLRPERSVSKKWVLAMLAAGNPVTLTQLPSFSNDGTLAALFLSLFVCALLIAESMGHYRIFLYSLILILCLNIGPPALVFTALLTAGFLLFLVRKKNFVVMKKIIYSTLLAAAIGFIFIGFHPYVTNLISEGTAFFQGSISDIRTSVHSQDSRWNSYIFPLWLLAVSGLAMLEWGRSRTARWIRWLLYGSLSLNLAWAVLGLVTSVLLSARADYQLRQIRTLNETVTLEFCPYHEFRSNEIRLNENGIPYHFGKVTGHYIENIVHSSSRIETQEPLPDLPKSFFVRWSEKFPGTAIY